MDFLQALQSADMSTVLIAAGLCLVCFLGFGLIGFVLSLLGFIGDLVGGVTNILFGLLGCGPLPGCGCVVVVIGLAGCGVMSMYVVRIVQSCGTPQAVNFCRLLGY